MPPTLTDVLAAADAVQRLRDAVEEGEKAQHLRKENLAAAEAAFNDMAKAYSADLHERSTAVANRNVGGPASASGVQWSWLVPTREAVIPAVGSNVMDYLSLQRTIKGQDNGTDIANYWRNPAVLKTPVMVPDMRMSVPKLIRELFSSNPYKVFTVPEIMDLLELGEHREQAVRQALRRLFEDKFLIKEKRGAYQLNLARRQEDNAPHRGNQ